MCMSPLHVLDQRRCSTERALASARQILGCGCMEFWRALARSVKHASANVCL